MNTTDFMAKLKDLRRLPSIGDLRCAAFQQCFFTFLESPIPMHCIEHLSSQPVETNLSPTEFIRCKYKTIQEVIHALVSDLVEVLDNHASRESNILCTFLNSRARMAYADYHVPCIPLTALPLLKTAGDRNNARFYSFINTVTSSSALQQSSLPKKLTLMQLMFLTISTLIWPSRPSESFMLRLNFEHHDPRAPIRARNTFDSISDDLQCLSDLNPVESAMLQSLWDRSQQADGFTNFSIELESSSELDMEPFVLPMKKLRVGEC